MKTFEEARLEFQEEHAATWYVLSNTPAFKAAKALVAEFSPSRRLPTQTAADIVSFGTVYCANDQGYFAALATFDALAITSPAITDPTPEPSYQPEDYGQAELTPAVEHPAPTKKPRRNKTK